MKLERPKFWQSLRAKIPLSFIAGALLIWLIVNFVTAFIGFFHLRSAVRERTFYEPVKTLLPALAATGENPEARRLVLAQISERLKDEQRRTAVILYYGLERYDYSELEFASLTVTDSVGIAGETISARLSGNPREVIKTLPTEQTVISAAVISENSERIFADDRGVTYFAVPIPGSNGPPSGALLVSAQVPFTFADVLVKLFWDFIYDLTDVWLYVVFLGVLFGIMQANQVMHELDEIARAVKSWSNGDFNDRAALPVSDELGLLAQRLNLMATELSEIFEMRQTLAAADERARLARDLHDSVKQQVFSLSMQIGAAQSLFDRDREQAFERIVESQKLTAQVQQELVELISELRLTNEKRGRFEDRLKTYLADWSRQCGITSEFSADGTTLLTPSVEHSLFRIFQEILANAARHSDARSVKVALRSVSAVRLSITVEDDGRGFDPAEVKKGLGLQNMTERVAAIEGGFLEIVSGSGTKIVFGVGTKSDEQLNEGRSA